VPNRQLTTHELEHLAHPLLNEIRSKLEELNGGDEELLWALRRKVAKELGYDERGKPMLRVALKKMNRREQNNVCALCKEPLPEDGSVLDRLEAMGGYTDKNTRVLCPSCDQNIQKERGYK
jgi:ribosomal protein L44E